MFFINCGICGKKEDFFAAEDDGWKKYGPPINEHHCPECLARDPKLNLKMVMMPVIAVDDGDEHKIDKFISERLKERHRGFDVPEDGSEKRYMKRRQNVPWVSHTFWWVVHNAVAHLAIAFCPIGPTFRFHDWTSRKMHGRP